jgi:site-specific DNA-cytosine methylase
VLDYIQRQKPRVFILENVSGLKNIKGGKYLAAIKEALEGLGTHNIYDHILNTKENGIPHHRKRWYCVGIMKSVDDGCFEWPEPIPCPNMEFFLEKRKPHIAATGLPPKSSSTAHRNVKIALRTLKREGSDPTKEPFVVDCDSSTYRFKWMEDLTPCITCSRGKGHWVTNRGRRLTKEEMFRLQGMDSTQFKVVVSDTQLGKQLGNTMSVNVFERLLTKVLPAAKLAKRGALVDRWKNGQAVRKLTATRGRGFKTFTVPRKRSAAETAPTRSLKRSRTV